MSRNTRESLPVRARYKFLAHIPYTAWSGNFCQASHFLKFEFPAVISTNCARCRVPYEHHVSLTDTVVNDGAIFKGNNGPCFGCAYISDTEDIILWLNFYDPLGRQGTSSQGWKNNCYRRRQMHNRVNDLCPMRELLFVGTSFSILPMM